MILVFVILGFFILINLLFFILILSDLKIEIKKLHIKTFNKKFSIDFRLDIKIYFLNKLKICKFTIDNERISNLIKSGKIDIKNLKVNGYANEKVLEILKHNSVKIECFKLEGYFSTFNNVLSSAIYAFINATIPIIIASRMRGKYYNNVKVVYKNVNLVNINLNCIISIKIVNIINILQQKKKGGKINNGKSSNRRSYAYCNE